MWDIKHVTSWKLNLEGWSPEAGEAKGEQRDRKNRSLRSRRVRKETESVMCLCTIG